MSEATKPLTQARVVQVLADLMTEGAPSAQWVVHSDAEVSVGRLDGQLMLTDDTEQRRALEVWQRVLGAGPVQARRVGARDHLTIHGSYGGVAVSVAALVDATPAGHCDCCQAGGAA